MTFDTNAPSPTEQQVLGHTFKRTDELAQELLALDQTLTGDLSKFSRADVFEMKERAFVVQQELASR